MREIKFRVWNKIDKEMVYCSSMEVEDNNRGLICYGNVYGADKIMEYTGLKDKNGKEIYEGDIVFLDCEGEVYWEKDTTSFSVKFKDGEYWELGMLDLNRLEVIGNIYENPELLEGDKNG